ncbi:MAG: hypothetical protein QOI06_3321 [Nocardioidaceae bacterium]|jgi:hypothetical protein|nr:hypothetical protein [Nocardioidaceae bacterium]
MPVVLIFFIAGGMITGGLALLDEANHRRAEDVVRRRQELEVYLLRREVDLEELRRQARDLGLDPDQVIAGYDAMRNHDITVEDIRRLLAGAAPSS